MPESAAGIDAAHGTPPERVHARDHGLRWSVALALAYSLAIFVLGLLLHPVLMLNAEADNYIGMARLLRDGVFIRDVFHPLLYPLLTMAGGEVIGDYFVAGKAVSAASAGMLIWCTHRLARLEISPLAGIVAPLLVALHPYVIVNAMLANDCMLSTALCAAIVLVCAQLFHRHSWRRVLVLGLLTATAYWSRYSTMAFAAPVGLTLLFAPATSHRFRLARAGAFLAAAVVSLTPHFVLSYLQFGKLLHDENWRNLAFSHFGNYDWNYLYTMPFHSWGDVFWHDPATILHNAGTRLAHFYGAELPAHLTARWILSWPEWGMYGLMLAGLTATLARGRPALAVAASGSFAYLTALVVVFHAWPNHVAVALPVLLVSSTALLRWADRPGARILAPLLIGLLPVIYVAWRVPPALRQFADDQPTAEFDAVRRLVSQHGPAVSIYVPFMAFGFSNQLQFQPSQSFYPADPLAKDDFLRRLQDAAVAREARFFVFGRVTMRSQQNLDALAAGPFPAPLQVVERSPHVLVLGSAGPSSAAEIPQVAVAPNPFRPGLVCISVFVEQPPAELTSLLLRARAPDGAEHWVPLPSSSDGSTFMTFESASLPSGRWLLEPFALSPNGRIAGPPMEWIVP